MKMSNEAPSYSVLLRGKGGPYNKGINFVKPKIKLDE